MRWRLWMACWLAVAGCTASPPPEPRSAGSIRSAEILTKYPPPGRLIDVGGRRLDILCKGPAIGPTTIIETAAIASGVFYWTVQDAIAETGRVCVYDRAGLGWSDPAPLPRSFKQRVEDLHRLLARSGEKPPYFLVGHSMGGLLVRLYQKKYPAEVAGLALIEASEEQVAAQPWAVESNRIAASQLEAAAAVLATGGDIPQLRPPSGPPEMLVATRESVVRAGVDDLHAMMDVSGQLEQAGEVGSLGALPLVIVTRGKPDRGWSPSQAAEWEAAQARLASLSRRSVRITAERSGHNVPYDQPTAFLAAIQNLRQLIGRYER